jgi:branched-subunit amino acid transport protein
MLNQWLLIGLLAVLTYLSRMIGVEAMAGRQLSPTLRLYFSYVPVGIMSALIMKQIFLPAEGSLSFSLPVLIGCLVAAISVKISNMFLPSVIIGVVIGWFVRYFGG